MTNEVIIAQKAVNTENVEKLKLFKMSKGYNWEIQLIGIDLKRLREINEAMIKEYGDIPANL